LWLKFALVIFLFQDRDNDDDVAAAVVAEGVFLRADGNLFGNTVPFFFFFLRMGWFMGSIIDLWLLPMNSNDHSTFGRKKKHKENLVCFYEKFL
jgi:hypothetical protein